MKIVYNKILPFKGFLAIMLFGIIFARKEYCPLRDSTIRHEEIHRMQVRDLKGYIPYYVSYLCWCIRRGYRNNPFEIEAYKNEGNPEYLTRRKKSAWKQYKTA